MEEDECSGHALPKPGECLLARPLLLMLCAENLSLWLDSPPGDEYRSVLNLGTKDWLELE